MKKTFIGVTLILSLILSLFTCANANSGVTVYVDNEVLQCDTAPFIKDGRTMVPMRKIFEALGAQVAWEGSTQTITATKSDKEIVLRINDSVMYNNGVAGTLDVAPGIVGGSTFVPLRAVSQCLDAAVEWNADTQTVYIKSVESNYVTIYSPYEGSSEIFAWELDHYKSLGWYTYPVAKIYSPYAEPSVVAQSEVQKFINDGWYTYPVAIMYAPDGRTLVVAEDEVADYKKVGWYGTYAEAQAANAPKYSDSTTTNTSGKNSYSSNATTNNQPNSGGSHIYRTPSGKKYHFDPDCGGKNSFETTLQKAQSAGLTPCKKCAQ